LFSNGTVFLFPAFAADYRENDATSIPGFFPLFKSLLDRASEEFDPDLRTFDPALNDFPEDGLLNQYITYLQSLTCSILLRREGITPDLVAGYSMGIYAACADTGAVSLKDGLELIRSAHREINGVITEGDFTMGAIIGLDEKDIRDLIAKTRDEAEIVNRNGEFSFVVSGRRKQLLEILSMAREEGAIHVSDLRVDEPYHSVFLTAAQTGFSEFISGVEFRDPSEPLISPIDQGILKSATDLKAEIVRNLYTPFDWYRTNQRMAELGITRFIESSPLRSLTRIAMFFPEKRHYFTASGVLSGTLPSHA